MRYSEEKIEFIANQIKESLFSKCMVTTDKTEGYVSRKISRIIMDNLLEEDRINEEVKRIIETYSRKIPAESTEWKVIFQQTKQRVAAKRNFIL